MPHLTPAVYHAIKDNNLDPRQVTATGKRPSGKTILTKGDVLAHLEGVKNGTIKATAPAVAKKAEAPKKAGSGKAGEYSRVLDVSKLEEMRDALNGGFGRQ
jgi:pyruvate/2-oxoglutarate dehydrogenase complex dihydrolipoamide acyltransferase (E2) component